jgi:hypothetical protein
MPVPRSRLAASATVTQSFVPSKLSAPPNRPVVVHVAPVIVPVWALPEESPTAVPAPSSKEYAAASPTGCPVAGPASAESETTSTATAVTRCAIITTLSPTPECDPWSARVFRLAEASPWQRIAIVYAEPKWPSQSLSRDSLS